MTHKTNSNDLSSQTANLSKPLLENDISDNHTAKHYEYCHTYKQILSLKIFHSKVRIFDSK